MYLVETGKELFRGAASVRREAGRVLAPGAPISWAFCQAVVCTGGASSRSTSAMSSVTAW